MSSEDEAATSADEAREKHPGGRPTKYRPEFVEQAAKLCKLGATDAELADFFSVSIQTLYSWRNVHPEFLDAIKTAKEAADERVQRSLFQRAIGYQVDAVKIFMPAGAVEPVYAPYRENVPADVASAIFWLKNRRPKDWKDRNHLTVDDKRSAEQFTDDELAAIAAGSSK
jgi:hypothetical protein